MNEALAREPQIARQMKMLDKRIASLEESIKQHETRIGNILSPSAPTKTLDGAEIAKEPRDPLATDLSVFADRIEAIEAHIADLTQRSEL